MAWHYVITNQLGALTAGQQQENVDEIYNILKDEWTLEAISAMLGNCQQESGINPAQTQSGYDIEGDSGGYGLFQWTPPHNYKNWANANGYSVYDGYYQIVAMNTPIPVGQYIETSAYPYSFSEFKQLTDIELATVVFLKNWERAGDEQLTKRVKYAKMWYTYLSGKPPQPTPSGKFPKLKPIFYGNKKIVYRSKINNLRK